MSCKDSTLAASAASVRRVLFGPLVLLFALGGGCRNADQQATRLLRDAEAAMSRQQWDAAFAKAHEAVLLAGLSEGVQTQARLKEDQARAELQAQINYARFSGAVDNDADTAVAAYRDLPATSYYRGLGKEAYERVRPTYIADHLEKAQAALANRRCADVKTQTQLVLDVDAANAKALDLGKQPCTVRKDE